MGASQEYPAKKSPLRIAPPSPRRSAGEIAQPEAEQSTNRYVRTAIDGNLNHLLAQLVGTEAPTVAAAYRTIRAAEQRIDRPTADTEAQYAAKVHRLRQFTLNVDNVDTETNPLRLAPTKAEIEAVPLDRLIGVVEDYAEATAKKTPALKAKMAQVARRKGKKTAPAEAEEDVEVKIKRSSYYLYRRAASYVALIEAGKAVAEFERAVTATMKRFTQANRATIEKLLPILRQQPNYSEALITQIILKAKWSSIAEQFAPIFTKLMEAYRLMEAYPPAEMMDILGDGIERPAQLQNKVSNRWKLTEAKKRLAQGWADQFWQAASRSLQAPFVAAIMATGCRTAELHTGIAFRPVLLDEQPWLKVMIWGAKTVNTPEVTIFERRRSKGQRLRSYYIATTSADTRFLWQLCSVSATSPDLLTRYDRAGTEGEVWHQVFWAEVEDGEPAMVIRWRPDLNQIKASKHMHAIFTDLHERAFGDGTNPVSPTTFRNLFAASIKSLRSEDGERILTPVEIAQALGHRSVSTQGHYGRAKQAEGASASRRPAVMQVKAVTPVREKGKSPGLDRSQPEGKG